VRPRHPNDEAMMTMTRARWTALDELTLRAGYQDGQCDSCLAGQLGRTPTAVREKRKRLGLRGRDRHTLSAAAVAQIMGVGCPKTVTSWVGRGWLRPIGGRRARPWRFDPGTLWDLVALPEAVVAIQPERIIDGELRAYAVEQRATHPRWLRLHEVARRYHVTCGTVVGWVAQGRFAPDDIARYDGLWIREAALAGFVPPCEQRWVRTACCRRRVPIGRSTPPTAALICAGCWPDVRVLPGGHLLRLVLPVHDGASAAAAGSEGERQAA
jgi:hypothetical protein